MYTHNWPRCGFIGHGYGVAKPNLRITRDEPYLQLKQEYDLFKNMHALLQDVAKEGGPGALTLLREADACCLRLTCFRLDLDLSLRTAIDVWTASVTHKPYALDPDFDL